MANLHPLVLLAFILLAAVALTQVSSFAPAPDAAMAGAQPTAPLGDASATPNHDPHRRSLTQPPTAATVATPNRDASQGNTIASFALKPEMLRAEPEAAAAPAMPGFAGPDIRASSTPPFAGTGARTALASAEIPAPSAPVLATAETDAPSAPALARVETEAPSAPAFIGRDTMLYAKDSARLRAAPSTAADILETLAADAPLRALARSTDGAWWRVSRAGGGVAYIHRVAVTQDRAVPTKPPAASSPVVAAAPVQPAPAPARGDALLNYVDKTMNWLAGAAAKGTPPKIVRSER